MVDVTPLDGGPANALGVIAVRGVVVPVVNPRLLLGVPPAEPAVDQLLVILHTERPFALWIDRAEEVRRVSAADCHVVMPEDQSMPASIVVRQAERVIPVLSPDALDPGPLLRRLEDLAA